jgi:cell shape-determining protein MreC
MYWINTSVQSQHLTSLCNINLNTSTQHYINTAVISYTDSFMETP